ncbi:MAG: 3-methyl-2-oxobutanoate hydroxymethyltransferase [Victivallaceae bacterium]|nr:3-methyl-2-oxobutanoate hydroxymethyltransferase [Victivallaceae bacterium]
MITKKKKTVSSFRKMKQNGEKIVAVTVYDAPTARLADAAGVDLLLVGDSLANTVLGYENTLPLTVEESLHHCKAARRGAPDAFIVGDMPFMSYQVSCAEALNNAGRYIKEAGCNAVKLEGGTYAVAVVERLVAAGIPVMGHIGLLPQQILAAGGYKIAGKTPEGIELLLADARALEKAGAFCMVLEGIPAEVSKQLTTAVNIPTIGIGAGPHCDGQVQVMNDLLGLFSDFVPKHAKRYANLTETVSDALTRYCREIRSGEFPTEEHSF